MEPKTFTFWKLTAVYVPRHKMLLVKLPYFGIVHLSKPYRALSLIRRLFPYFYCVGLMDCDTGGRVHVWYRAWGINYWHCNRVLESWNGAGDGEVYTQISFKEFRSIPKTGLYR
jgi:hypothetical protein